MSEESPRYKQLFAYLTQAESEADLEQIMSDMTLEGTAAKSSCPTLLASGEYDPRSPIEDVYDYFDEFLGNAELWVYADQHHMISVLGRHEVPLWQLDAYPFTMDWLRDRLRGEKFENAGKVAYLEPGGVGPNSDNVSRRRQWFA